MTDKKDNFIDHRDERSARQGRPGHHLFLQFIIPQEVGVPVSEQISTVHPVFEPQIEPKQKPRRSRSVAEAMYFKPRRSKE